MAIWGQPYPLGRAAPNSWFLLSFVPCTLCSSLLHPCCESTCSWLGRNTKESGRVLPSPQGWFGADLLCDLGQVALPLWDSVSSVQWGGWTCSAVCSRLLVCGFLPSWGWHSPAGNSLRGESSTTLSSVPYSTPASGRLHIFV